MFNFRSHMFIELLCWIWIILKDDKYAISNIDMAFIFSPFYLVLFVVKCNSSNIWSLRYHITGVFAWAPQTLPCNVFLYIRFKDKSKCTSCWASVVIDHRNLIIRTSIWNWSYCCQCTVPYQTIMEIYDTVEMTDKLYTPRLGQSGDKPLPFMLCPIFPIPPAFSVNRFICGRNSRFGLISVAKFRPGVLCQCAM